MCAIRPAALLILAAALAQGQIVISGNENKIDLTSGEAKIVPNAPPDSISIMRFTEFPPKVEHITGVRNSVIGPPSNIAITPDESLALIASSLHIDPQDATKWIPDNVVHVLDLTQRPPQVIQEVKVDKQPSGISITRDGRYALVANRASGTVSLLGIEGKRLSLLHTEKVCDAAENISDIAIHPNGEVAIASVCKGRYLIILRIEHGRLVVTERKLTVYGEPYRCAISPDGTLAVTAGSGLGMPDIDAVTVVDLTSDPIRTSDYIPIPSGPESLEISPDGKQLAVVVMNGSNLAPDKPLRTDHGLLVVLSRRGNTFVKTQELPTGRIPEGVAYSPDGRYIIVQTHPDKELWHYEVQGEKVVDTGKRIAVPGFPSSIRIAERPVAGPAAPAPAAATLRESSFFAMSTGTKDDQHATFAAQADMLKELGYAGTDLLGTQGLPELLAELDRQSLKFFALYSGLNIDAGGPQWDPGMEEAIRLLKGRDAILWVPMTSKTHAPSSPEGDEAAVQALNQLADLAALSGLRIALYPHTGDWLERVEDAVRIADKVNRPEVGVTFNLCHWLRVDGQDLRARLELARPRLFIVTLNGAEVGGTDWITLIQTLDRGNFELKSLLLMLKDLGYTGPIGLQGYGIGGDVHDNLQRSMATWRALHG